MLKHLLFALCFFGATPLFAQSAPGILMVATTREKKICSDYKWEAIPVTDIKASAEKLKEYKEANKENAYAGVSSKFVRSGKSVVAFRFKVKKSGFNCSPDAIVFVDGNSIAHCHEQMNERVAKNPDAYLSTPEAIYEWPRR